MSRSDQVNSLSCEEFILPSTFNLQSICSCFMLQWKVIINEVAKLCMFWINVCKPFSQEISQGRSKNREQDQCDDGRSHVFPYSFSSQDKRLNKGMLRNVWEITAWSIEHKHVSEFGGLLRSACFPWLQWQQCSEPLHFCHIVQIRTYRVAIVSIFFPFRYILGVAIIDECRTSDIVDEMHS